MNAHSWRQETDSSAEILSGTAAKGQMDPPKGASEPRLQIKIGKTVIPRPAEGEGVVAEIFTMTLGEETIQLVPLKNWSQLDVLKWRARGLLPGTPAGLEITFDHLKVAGETASPWDPKSSVKLEKVFNDWLALARGTLDSAKEKARLPTAQTSSAQPEEDALRFQGELDNRGKARLKCLEGSETVKVVALNLQGLNALIEQGLIFKRKTPDGGEDYLEPGPETVVSITSDDGQIKTIELSQPVSLLSRTARELTAVFNHPAINRRARLAQGAGVAVQAQ